MANTQCTINISTVTSYPWLLEDGQELWAQIIAVNSIGESDPSTAATGSTVFVPIVPGAPVSLLENYAGTTKTTASFTWSEGESGGKVITDFKVEYDQAQGIWIEIATGITENIYTATGLSTGLTY
jgi:hypothetical protein